MHVAEKNRLPIHAVQQQLVDTLYAHQAIVIEGETGSGKTTQIPQIVLDSGIVGPEMRVAVTQPRRIAAISVAHRIAQERGSTVPGEVGYAIRFDDQTTPETRLKIMTDGLLLQEIRLDPDLSRYGLIMVDEAHERSLNIDFTMGLLRRLMDRRPDLRVVISSATLDPARFSRFFNDAPRIAVPGRTYPVDVRWRPLEDDSWEGRVDDVARVIARIHKREPDGDILVFLSGEGEIRAAMAAVESLRLRGLALLPLFGRLTREEQELVFKRFPGRRKVVFSTNIAETSITIDGIKYVVDLGLAKIPSYDPRTGISALRETPIPRASARQRMGRAGRTAPGLCVRLYDKNDFSDRPEFMVEEIMRMNLAEVALRLIDLGVYDVETFPFVTRPPRSRLMAALGELYELGAITRGRQLTDIGRRMVAFPLGPRLARMLIEAADQHRDVFHEVLTVASLMSIRSPQVTPAGDEETARSAHKRFSHPLGDHIAGLNMIRAYETARDRTGFCEQNYLDADLMAEVLRIREQLRDIAKSVGLRGGSGGKVESVVQCIAVAYFRNVCHRRQRGNGWETAMGVRVSIHPGSCLFGKRPDLIVAGDLVITGRAWARSCSVIRPEWLIEMDPDLAHHWGYSRRSRAPKKKDVERHRDILLNGNSYSVKVKRGRPTIKMDLGALRSLRLDDLNKPEKALGVIVTHEGERLLRGLSLGEAINALPLLDLVPSRAGVQLGEVFEAERELHQIMRGFPRVLRATQRRGKKRGIAFLTLIPNGSGAYWFEATGDLRLAVEQTRLALDCLQEELVADDDAVAKMEDLAERAEALAEALGL